VVVYNELTPLFRDCDIFIAHMFESMLQCAIKISIPRRHIEHAIAREASHSAGVPALLAWFRPHLESLLAGCRLAAFVHSLDIPILIEDFRLVPN